MVWFASKKKLSLPTAEEALPGRSTPLKVAPAHTVLGTRMVAPWPDGLETIVFGLGCFWGAERRFWTLPGVYSTQVGYAGGLTPNPTYEEVCSGRTGHNEVVRVVFDPAKVSLQDVLARFWEAHDPTQGMRQGNDVGTQYRSGIYATTPAQLAAALGSRSAYDAALKACSPGSAILPQASVSPSAGLAGAKGFAPITTEVIAAPEFYYAEDYHQQYLDKNPAGYCGIGGTGVCYPS